MKRVLFVFLFSLFTSTVFAQNVADNLLVDASDSVWGDAKASVTIVMYTDLQCPFCKRAHATIDAVEKKYSKNVRIVFRHFPLVFHKQAESAARAAVAAQKQGEFRAMADLIFKNQKELRKNKQSIDSYLASLASQLGLDEAKFMADYRSSSVANKVKADMKSGTALGVRGTPHFFINGERLSGAQPLPKFETLIDAQIKAANSVTGVSGEQRYQQLFTANFKKKPVRKKDIKVQYVPIDKGDPIWGSKKALVTIIEFSEFQCPFCERVNPTLKRLKKKYGNKLRIVYKQNPLSFHKQAEQASRAALAANKQGKFVKMKDLLYKNMKKFKSGDMDALMMTLAKKAGLKMGRFETDYYSDELKAHIQTNIAQAKEVGATGTPSFFINGVRFSGAQPYEKFVPIVKQQLAVAKRIRKREKLSGNKLYRAVVNENEKNEPEKIKDLPVTNKASAKALKKLKKPFWKGKKRAKVVVHMMSDFQCPFCQRASITMDTLYGEYKDRVKFVFVNVYLPFHKDAKIAHLAAIAAGRQGKFWEMHDKIFKRGKEKITQDLLDRYAEQLNLNMKHFHRDRVSSKTKKQLIREGEIAKKAGLRGTPNFNINGEMVVGAKSIETFREVLDRHLKK